MWHNKSMNELDCKPPMLRPKCKKIGFLTIEIIPAQLGTSDEGQPYAPKFGAHTDTIVKYLADGKIFAYDKEGNFTFISDIDAVAPTIDVELNEYSTNPVQNRAIAEAINELTASLEDEISNRTTADETLQDNIDNEETARTTADETLQDNIDNEETARIAADTTLQNNIDELNTDLTNEILARQSADTTLQGNIDALNTNLTGAINDEATARANKDTALEGDISTINTAIDKTVMTDLTVNPTTSTTVVQLDTSKQNIKTSATVTGSIPLPVASATQAGVMNSATFNAIAKNTQDIANIIGEVVAVTGLPASPTQAQLTNAWLTASGESTLINGAGIYDVTNAKRWTYYANDTTWHYLDASGSVQVNTWTNNAAGIVKGSTNNGQIFAESDGTGSVNGWDTLSSQVSTNTSKLATIESGAEVNVQSNWNQTNTNADDYIKNKPTLATVATTGAYSDLSGTPTLATVATSGSYTDLSNKPTIPTVNNGTLTIKKNGTQVATFTANQSGSATADITVPTKTSDITNDSGFLTASSSVFDDIAYINGDATVTTGPAVGTNNITDGAITAAKIADGATSQITMTTVDPGEGADLAANHFIAVYEA